MANIIDQLEREGMKESVPEFAIGDTVKVVHDSGSEPVLQHGGEAAFEDIGAEDCQQHADEEEVALGDREAHLGREESDDGEPVDPDEGVEDIEKEAREEELPVVGDMLDAEFEVAARDVSFLHLAAPGEDGEDGGGNAADDRDIDIVEDGGEIIEIKI